MSATTCTNMNRVMLLHVVTVIVCGYKCNSGTIMNTTQLKSHMQHSCSHTCNSVAVIHATVDARCRLAGFAHKRVRSRSHTCNSITVIIATTGTNVCQVMLLHVVARCCSYKLQYTSNSVAVMSATTCTNVCQVMLLHVCRSYKLQL